MCGPIDFRSNEESTGKCTELAGLEPPPSPFGHDVVSSMLTASRD